ncbi:uncharacterized protein N7500_009807 [Penicillium coprophilum]|uniref:uncharacterized protein n=1 Tax=Penicillium coprophilum TaxID=36646 RepID=UPI0023963B22|nr:uncharacterized protein N7500_009807 [Penicillium coprophilum]KAJ5154368.1 hypothetical protein N7500_009807 [Penicillium coprophilum]
MLSVGPLRASDQACPAVTEGVATSDGCETSSRPIHHRANSSPPPAFSLEPTSPDSTVPESQIPYIRCLSERRGLRRRTPTVSEKRVPVCFIHLMCSNGRPCSIPLLLSPATEHLEPWQPPAHPHLVPLVTGESAVEFPRQLSSIVPGESGGEARVP